MREKSIIDLGIEVWNDVLMCPHLGIPNPTITMRTRVPWSDEEMSKVFRKPPMEISEYWLERAKLRGYLVFENIKRITILVQR